MYNQAYLLSYAFMDRLRWSVRDNQSVWVIELRVGMVALHWYMYCTCMYGSDKGPCHSVHFPLIFKSFLKILYYYFQYFMGMCGWGYKSDTESTSVVLKRKKKSNEVLFWTCWKRKGAITCGKKQSARKLSLCFSRDVHVRVRMKFVCQHYM